MSSAAALDALGHATSGSLGSSISTALLYPLETTITRLKAQKPLPDHKTNDGIIRAFERILRDEGVEALYHGLAPAMAKSIIDSFLFFGFYHYLKPKHRQPRILEELALGALAGAASKLVTTPVSNVVTLQQASSGESSDEESFGELISGIKRRSGLLGLWSGYSATMVLTLNPSITFLLNRRLAAWVIPVMEHEDIPVAWMAFLLAAGSKTAATAVTYPFQTAKTRLQVASADKKSKTQQSQIKTQKSAAATVGYERRLHRIFEMLHRSIFGVVLQIFQSEGVPGLLRGLQGEALKSFLSHGTTMLAKGLIYRLVVRLWMKRQRYVQTSRSLINK